MTTINLELYRPFNMGVDIDYAFKGYPASYDVPSRTHNGFCNTCLRQLFSVPKGTTQMWLKISDRKMPDSYQARVVDDDKVIVKLSNGDIDTRGVYPALGLVVDIITDRGKPFYFTLLVR